jgi:hypothetical protein
LAQLLAKAAERGLHTTSFRLGQICGSQRAGTWAVTDWVPILVRSSVALGCLPDAQGVMSWISPEAVSGTILDVALGADTPERALNVVHPRPIAWSSMMGAVADELVRHEITEDRLPLVETREWFAKLAEAAEGADEAQLKHIVRECAAFSARLSISPPLLACDQAPRLLPRAGGRRRRRARGRRSRLRGWRAHHAGDGEGAARERHDAWARAAWWRGRRAVDRVLEGCGAVWRLEMMGQKCMSYTAWSRIWGVGIGTQEWVM